MERDLRAAKGLVAWIDLRLDALDPCWLILILTDHQERFLDTDLVSEGNHLCGGHSRPSSCN